MKIALFFSPRFLSGKEIYMCETGPVQFLTGTELSFVRHAQNLSRSHEVHVYTPGPTTRMCRGYDLPERIVGYDVAIAWNDAVPLKRVGSSTLRLVSYQFNSFEFHDRDVESYVDRWLSPSEKHMSMVPIFYQKDRFTNPDMSKWSVLPNGCDPRVYDALWGQGVMKVAGKVLWASSPDRGLHHLLEIWSEVRRRVPWASLHVAYSLIPWLQRVVKQGGFSPEETERANRTWDLVRSFQPLPDKNGLRILDAIGHDVLCTQMAESQVLAYPCDPYRWTEGYSVTLMEACAARACPVTAAVDAIPSIYGAAVPMVPSQARNHLPEYTDLLVRALTDREFREGVNARARALAETQTWERSTEVLLETVRRAQGAGG